MWFLTVFSKRWMQIAIVVWTLITAAEWFPLNSRGRLQLDEFNFMKSFLYFLPSTSSPPPPQAGPMISHKWNDISKMKKKGSRVHPHRRRWIYVVIISSPRDMITFFLAGFSGHKPIKVHVRFVWWFIRNKKLRRGDTTNVKLAGERTWLRSDFALMKTIHALIIHIRVGWLHGRC